MTCLFPTPYIVKLLTSEALVSILSVIFFLEWVQLWLSGGAAGGLRCGNNRFDAG